MRTHLIDAGNQKTDSVGPLAVVLRVGLRAVANCRDETFDWDCSAVGKAAGERLLFHEVGQDAGVGGEAGEGEAQVLVDGDYLFLVGGEFFCVTLGRIGG